MGQRPAALVPFRPSEHLQRPPSLRPTTMGGSSRRHLRRSSKHSPAALRPAADHPAILATVRPSTCPVSRSSTPEEHESPHDLAPAAAGLLAQPTSPRRLPPSVKSVPTTSTDLPASTPRSEQSTSIPLVLQHPPTSPLPRRRRPRPALRRDPSPSKPLPLAPSTPVLLPRPPTEPRHFPLQDLPNPPPSSAPPLRSRPIPSSAVSTPPTRLPATTSANPAARPQQPLPCPTPDLCLRAPSGVGAARGGDVGPVGVDGGAAPWAPLEARVWAEFE